jgi:tRNA-guanine transglycosylase
MVYNQSIMFRFELLATSGAARAGIFHTPHGPIPTPVFAPVGTQATVKALTPAQLQAQHASLILANTYHLYLRPGADLVAEMGGLHRFMNWQQPILTDSGGYQVFSLGALNKIDANGVTFRSHIDGSRHRFTPESAIAIQNQLGADIIMAFDQCPPPYDRAENEKALARTHAWLMRCIQAQQNPAQALFGIVQGGTFADLRAQSAEFVAKQDLPGNAIGGLSVGESKIDMHAMLEVVCPLLPSHKPRYLMGVGSPRQLGERHYARHRHVRLCAAHTLGAPSCRVQRTRAAQPPQSHICARPFPPRCHLCMLHLSKLHSRLPAPFVRGGRDPFCSLTLHSQHPLLNPLGRYRSAGYLKQSI